MTPDALHLFLRLFAGLVFEAVALAGGGDDLGVVSEAVEDGEAASGFPGSYRRWKGD